MFHRDRFIADCRDAVTDAVTKERAEIVVRDLLARAVSHPSAVEASLGPPQAGGLFSLYRSPELTILNVVWTPGMAIYPHEHRMWTVIGPHGLVAAGGKRLERADTALFGEKIIHAVANPLRAFTAALKAEAKRRAVSNAFFGYMAYASMVARKP